MGKGARGLSGSARGGRGAPAGGAAKPADPVSVLRLLPSWCLPGSRTEEAWPLGTEAGVGGWGEVRIRGQRLRPYRVPIHKTSNPRS